MSDRVRVLKLTIAYDGIRYAGWQRQDHRAGSQPTIQATLERVLSQVVNERVRVVGSGRTDSGTHALAQVAHVQTRSRLPVTVIQRALNSGLPPDIVVRRVAQAGEHFHARFAAKRKRYCYRVRMGERSPFDRHYVHHVRGVLDVLAMRRAARALKGEHDFHPFQAAGSRITNTVRRVTDVGVHQRNGYIAFELEATGFLYKMVRRIVGTLLLVGRGQRPETVMRQILATGDAALVGPTAPAQGLTLVAVTY